MYSHIGSLAKNGAKDVHTGTSMDRAGAKYKSGFERSSASKATSSKGGGSSGPRIKMGVQGKVRSVKNTSSAGPVKQAPSFGRMKGVVNTINGAKDTTRKTESRLPPKSERSGPRVMSFDTMAHATGSAKSGNTDFVKRGSGLGGGAGASVSSAGTQPRKPLRQRKAEAAAAAKKTTSAHRLGGGGKSGAGRTAGGGRATAAATTAASMSGKSGASGGRAAAPNAAADRAKRAAYFEKLMSSE